VIRNFDIRNLVPVPFYLMHKSIERSMETNKIYVTKKEPAGYHSKRLEMEFLNSFLVEVSGH
jgi:hypothetical protein